jgi:hypothetical protein
MTRIDPAWLEPFDQELFHLFAIDHGDAGMDEYLLGCYAKLPARDAALAFIRQLRCGHGRARPCEPRSRPARRNEGHANVVRSRASW